MTALRTRMSYAVSMHRKEEGSSRKEKRGCRISNVVPRQNSQRQAWQHTTSMKIVNEEVRFAELYSKLKTQREEKIRQDETNRANKEARKKAAAEEAAKAAAEKAAKKAAKKAAAEKAAAEKAAAEKAAAEKAKKVVTWGDNLVITFLPTPIVGVEEELETPARKKAEEEAANAEEEASARKKAEEETPTRTKAEVVVEMRVVFGFFKASRNIAHSIQTTMTFTEMQKYVNADSLHSIALNTKHMLTTQAMNLLVIMGSVKKPKSTRFFNDLYDWGLSLFVYDRYGEYVRTLRVLPPMEFQMDTIGEVQEEERMKMIKNAAIGYFTDKETYVKVFGHLVPENS